MDRSLQASDLLEGTCPRAGGPTLRTSDRADLGDGEAARRRDGRDQCAFFTLTIVWVRLTIFTGFFTSFLTALVVRLATILTPFDGVLMMMVIGCAVGAFLINSVTGTMGRLSSSWVFLR